MSLSMTPRELMKRFETLTEEEKDKPVEVWMCKKNGRVKEYFLESISFSRPLYGGDVPWTATLKCFKKEIQ